ncbi:helix-turn-helix domain-containing protein [Priestia koreensis]|uniref:helix-turn-helix domain-containing protein n=1 Tax=Priestia koreensis TaxID=284581 RepID=UPI001F5889D3|nr:helix-turn-helix domain-containing protein [Priestia koreensis]UNL86786.1 tetratricopeptide repeat protein [Priestia koreensis]
MDTKAIGERIRQMRLAQDMKQKDLAEGIVTRGYISQIEKGNAKPSIEILKSIADKLEVSLAFLLEESPEEQNDRDHSDLKKKHLFFNHSEYLLDNRKFSEFEKLLPELEEDSDDFQFKSLSEYLLGRYYWETKRFNHAKQYLEKSIGDSLPINFDVRAKALNLQGKVMFKLGKYQGALQCFNNALQLTRQVVNDPVLQIDILLNLGVFHCHLEEITSSITYLLKAEQLCKSKDIFYRSGEIHMTLGVCYRKTNNFSEAKIQYNKALYFFEQTDNQLLKAGILLNLGILSNQTKEYKGALKYIEDALVVYENHFEEDLALNAKLELAETLFHMDKLNDCESLCKELLKYEVDHIFKAQLYILLGKVITKNVGLESALSYFKKAETICQETLLFNKLHTLYHVMGNAYFSKENYELAAKYYKKSLNNKE